MTDLTHWDFAEEFSAQEAAALILGADPTDLDGQKRAQPIFRRLRASYHLAWCYWHVRCDGFFELNEEEVLPDNAIQSIGMQSLAAKLISNMASSGMQEYFCNWIGWETSDEPKPFGSGFSQQRFSREELARWLRAIGLKSAYSFTEDTPSRTSLADLSKLVGGRRSPEQWREQVADVLDKHNGNKTKAAKELGISRVRVGQLVNVPSSSDRKPLTALPQDPFGRTNKSASNKRSR